MEDFVYFSGICIERFRDSNKEISVYRLKSDDGKRVEDIRPDQLKKLIKTGYAKVHNLKLTTDNRLILKKDKAAKPNLEIIALIYDDKIINTDEIDLSVGEMAAVADTMTEQAWLVRIENKFGFLKPDELYIKVNSGDYNLINAGAENGIDSTDKYHFIKMPFTEVAAISACELPIGANDDRVNIKLMPLSSYRIYLPKYVKVRKDFKEANRFVREFMRKMPGYFESIINI